MSSTNQRILGNFFHNKKKVQEIEKNKLKSSSPERKNIKLEDSFEEDEEILRRFDFNPLYGPAIGLTRTQRYENSIKFGLYPSEKIMTLILRSNSDISYFEK